jgi:hypothetical protein
VIENKARVTFGRKLKFENQVNYSRVHRDQNVVKRETFLGLPGKAEVETKAQPHYQDQYLSR